MIFAAELSCPIRLKSDELKLSFTAIGCPELGVHIDFGPVRRVSYLIARYPDLAEFRAMLEGWSAKRSWNGRHFLMTRAKEKGPAKFTLWLRQSDVGIEFTEKRMGCPARTVPEGVGDPRGSAVVAGASTEYGEQG